MFKKIENVFEKLEEWVISLSVILMAALLIVNVIMRTIFNSSLTFSEEIGQFLLIIISFFGIGYCVRQNKHINMSIIFDAVSKNNKKRMMLLISSVSAIVMIALSILSLQYVISVIRFGRTSPALNIPMFWFYISIPFGFIIGAIEYFGTLIANIKNKDDVYLSCEVNLEKAMEIEIEENFEEKEA